MLDTMLNLISISVLLVCVAIWYAVESIRTKRYHQKLIQQHNCKPLKCLPNKWFPPLGLDQLGKVIEAEKARAYPLLMLGDHEKYGTTYGQWGGPVYTVITCDPENIREILSRQFKNFEVGSGRHGCVRPLLGDGVFTQDGRKWEHSRKMLAPLIQRPTLPDLGLVERHFQQLRARITATATSGVKKSASASDSEVGNVHLNLRDLLFDLSLDLTTEFLLGDPAAWADRPDDEKAATTTTKATTSVWADAFASEFNTAFRWIAKRERLKGFYWMIDGREFRRACADARRKVDDVIARSRRALRHAHGDKTTTTTTAAGESYVALEPLLREAVATETIRDQFLNLLLAGRDTSGSLLCWVFYALGREPELVRALRREMAEVLHGNERREPSKEDLRRMKKLDCFITETLRVFPPVPLNCRFSVENTTLPRGGGDDGQSPVLIPKGTLIAFSTFATHHSPELYGDDANRFRIDRWHDDVIKERRMIDWSYHPFIGGPRKCLGERFAILQAKYLTCRMLQHFDEILATDETGNAITYRPDGTWVDDVKYHVGLTMSPDEGVWVRLVSQA